MKKLLKSTLLIVLFLLLMACSANDWSYKYEGNSEHFQAVLEIIPDESDGAKFIGKLKTLSEEETRDVHYEVDVTGTSNKAGKIRESITVEDGFIRLFVDIPNTERYSDAFRAGKTADEVKAFFGDYPVFNITWQDKQGTHSEIIKLEFVEQ